MINEKSDRSDKQRPHGRAFVTYKAEGGLLSFMRKPSPRLPVRSVSKDGMEFRSIEAPEVGQRIILSLWSQHHPKATRIRAQVSAVTPETRIGEQTYAFLVGVKFVEISTEAWEIIHRLSH